MGASCCRNDATNTYKISSSHAYTVIKAQEIKDKSGKSVKLLKIRDPWGTEQYDGPWNDKDENWSTQLRIQTGAVNRNDGIFWVPVETFIKTFNYFTIMYYRDNYKESRLQMNETAGKHTTYAQFKNPVAQDVIVQLEFQNDRTIPSGCPKVGAQYYFTIYKSYDNAKKRIGGIDYAWTHRWYNNGVIKLPSLAPGEYFVRMA